MKRFILITFILIGLFFTSGCDSKKGSDNGNGGGTMKVNEFVFNNMNYLVREGRQDFYGSKYGEGTKCINVILGSKLTGFYITVDFLVKNDKLEKGIYTYRKELNTNYAFGNAKMSINYLNGGKEINITGTTITVSLLDDGRYKMIFNCKTEIEDKSEPKSSEKKGDDDKKYLSLIGVFVGNLPWHDATTL